MSVREVTMYQIVCDEPGCGFKTGDEYGAEYVAWAEESQAVDIWTDADHQFTPEGKHYCDKHRKPECCGCDKTEGVVQLEDDGDWFCPEHAAEERS